MLNTRIIDVDQLLLELKPSENSLTDIGLKNYDIRRLSMEDRLVYGPSLSIRLPFNKDEGNESSDGYAMIKGYKNLVKQNFRNLMLSAPGEKLMDKNFGVGLRNYLFENRSATLESTLRKRIKNQIRRYMNYLAIEEIKFSDKIEEFSAIPVGENFLRIRISYFVEVIQTEDTLDLGLLYDPRSTSI